MPADPDAVRAHLTLADPVLGRAIAPLPHPASHASADIYRSLITAIISQQLSVKAADTIAKRLLALFDDGYPHADRLVNLSVEELRAVGLSRPKAGYLQAIARHHLDEPIDAGRLACLDDEAVIAELTAIKGVGRWTVEMLLIFPMNRPDVFSPLDVGIQNAMKHLYGLDLSGRALMARMSEIATPWAPHRSAACRYLWAYKATI